MLIVLTEPIELEHPRLGSHAVVRIDPLVGSPEIKTSEEVPEINGVVTLLLSPLSRKEIIPLPI
jgi:hypothetical protein